MTRATTNKHVIWLVKQRVWQPTKLISEASGSNGEPVVLEGAVRMAEFQVDVAVWSMLNALRR